MQYKIISGRRKAGIMYASQARSFKSLYELIQTIPHISCSGYPVMTSKELIDQIEKMRFELGLGQTDKDIRNMIQYVPNGRQGHPLYGLQTTVQRLLQQQRPARIKQMLKQLSSTSNLNLIKKVIFSFMDHLEEYYAEEIGFKELSDDLPSLIIPDIHARRRELYTLLFSRHMDGERYVDKIIRGELQLVCLGDYMHSENPAKWVQIAAMNVDFDSENLSVSGLKSSTHYLDQEMTDSLGVVALLMCLKRLQPDNVVLLEGNHENALHQKGPKGLAENQSLTKNQVPFGEICKHWFIRNFGDQRAEQYALFENKLPLIVTNSIFVAAHSRPDDHAIKMSVKEIAAKSPQAVVSFTWTRSNESLMPFLQEKGWPRRNYFSGHEHQKSYVITDGQNMVINDKERLTAVWVEYGLIHDINTRGKPGL